MMRGHMSTKGVQASMAASNAEAARIITADPNRYPGVLQEWAERILAPTTEAEPEMQTESRR
jgi:hypothetical protein